MPKVSPPSHVTPAQAGRILAEVGVAPATIYGLLAKGKPLQAEIWYGSKMIPAWRVDAYQQKLKAERGL